MTNHVADDLPRLLTGEATRGEVLAAAAHLRSCDDCREELVSAVVAHASLSSAQRFAPEIMSILPSGPGNGTDDDTDPAARPPLPDLSAVFATVRAEVAADAPAAPPARRKRVLIAVGAVAAGVLIGSGVTVLATGNGSGPSAHAIALAPYDIGKVSGSASLTSNDHLVVNASSLPKLPADSTYEIWLTNAARSKMQPVGWIPDSGKADVSMPDSLVSAYDHVEVSVQKVAAPYTYSGVSVLRGRY